MATPGIHSKCGAWKRTDGAMLICSRSYGHFSPQCYDSDEDTRFLTSTADGLPWAATRKKRK